jgi:Sec-independent protein translocase protein TatA
MIWLRAVPVWAWACLGLAVLVLIQDSRLSDVNREFAEYREGVERAAREAAEAALEERKRIEKELAEVDQHAIEQKQKSRADADRAQSELDRLSALFKAAERRAVQCGNSITAQLSEAAERDARVRSDMLGRLGKAAAGYAAIADERGVAARACEAAYDAVRLAP